jgi:hypothetical protein
MYSDYIMNYVRQNLGLKSGDTSMDDEIFAMPKDEIFDRTVEWNGLGDWGGALRGWIESIYGINLGGEKIHEN